MLSNTPSGMCSPGSALAERMPAVPSLTSVYMLAKQMQVEKHSIPHPKSTAKYFAAPVV